VKLPRPPGLRSSPLSPSWAGPGAIFCRQRRPAFRWTCGQPKSGAECQRQGRHNSPVGPSLARSARRPCSRGRTRSSFVTSQANRSMWVTRRKRCTDARVRIAPRLALAKGCRKAGIPRQAAVGAKWRQPKKRREILCTDRRLAAFPCGGDLDGVGLARVPTPGGSPGMARITPLWMFGLVARVGLAGLAPGAKAEMTAACRVPVTAAGPCGRQGDYISNRRLTGSAPCANTKS
jgi:hypothetical protein